MLFYCVFFSMCFVTVLLPYVLLDVCFIDVSFVLDVVVTRCCLLDVVYYLWFTMCCPRSVFTMCFLLCVFYFMCWLCVFYLMCFTTCFYHMFLLYVLSYNSLLYVFYYMSNLQSVLAFPGNPRNLGIQRNRGRGGVLKANPWQPSSTLGWTTSTLTSSTLMWHMYNQTFDNIIDKNTQ